MYSLLPLFVTFIICIGSNILIQITRTKYNRSHLFYTYQHISSYVVVALFCGLTTLAINGLKLNISRYTLLLALAFGLVTSLQSIVHSLALKNGPVGYTVLISQFTIVFTSLMGVFIFHEEFKITYLIGMVLMIGCAFFSIDKSKDKDVKKSVIWLTFSLTSVAFLVLTGFLQKYQQASEYKDEFLPFLTIASFFGSAISIVASIIFRAFEKKNIDSKEEKERLLNKKHILFFIIFNALIGIFYGFNHSSSLFLAGAMPAVILYPLLYGLVLMLSFLVGVLIFKERFSYKQIIGIVLGVIGVVVLVIF